MLRPLICKSTKEYPVNIIMTLFCNFQIMPPLDLASWHGYVFRIYHSGGYRRSQANQK